MKLFRYRFTPLIAVFWIISLWMLQQNVSSRSFLTKDAQIDINDGALIMRQDYLGFYLGGGKIGHSEFILKEDNEESLSKLPGKFYLFSSEMNLKIQAMGMVIEVKTRQLGEVNEDLSMRSFQFDFKASGQELYVLGVVDDEGLHVTTKSEGSQNKRTIKVPDKIYNPDVIHLLLAREGLEIGKTYVYPIYDPLNMALGNINAKVEDKETITLPNGKKADTFRIDMNFKGVHTTSWINKDGDLYKEISQIAGIEFVALRETQEQAEDLTYTSEGVTKDKSAKTLDLVYASKITPETQIPNPKAVSELKVKLVGATLDDVVIDDYFQFLVEEGDDELILHMKQRDYPTLIASLPEGKPPFEKKEDVDDSYLESDALIQSDHPRIREKALEITKGVQNRWEACQLIGEWLMGNISPINRITIPSALEVLKKMEGDCNEYSTLFAAMARSIGIPAKIVAGLVYMDDGFYYHAWNEVYLDGKWIPIDSTLDRIQMDAAHIKLAEGSLDAMSNIVRLVGNLDIEIISFDEG